MTKKLRDFVAAEIMRALYHQAEGPEPHLLLKHSTGYRVYVPTESGRPSFIDTEALAEAALEARKRYHRRTAKG